MATRPATAPHAAPTALNFLWWTYWARTQVTVAAAAAVLVATNVVDARPLAASAEPALKPNQPNHSRPGAQDGHRHVVRIHLARRPCGACR